jgi:hypothetical protein
VLENIANLDQEMKVDPKQLNNADVNMLTCTPVLAGRVLGGHVPQSPFLVSNQNRNDATPIMARVQVRQNGDSAQMNMMNGIVFNKPMFGVNPAGQPGKPNNPYEVAPVPQFKKAGPAAQNVTNVRKNLLGASVQKPPEEQQSPKFNVSGKEPPAFNKAAAEDFDSDREEKYFNI